MHLFKRTVLTLLLSFGASGQCSRSESHLDFSKHVLTDSFQNDETNWREYQSDYLDSLVLKTDRNNREDIYRPCDFTNWQCVRRYLASNSKCIPVYGPGPDPLYLERNTVYYPYLNITFLATSFTITGLGNMRITEFYVNKMSGNLVLALEFRNLNETTPRGVYRYRRTGKESIVISDYATVEYRSGTFTAVIPKYPNLRLDLAEIHVDMHDNNPRFFLGPGGGNSTDPDVIDAFAQFNTNIPTGIQEGFVFLSPLFMIAYIQKSLCDFGVKLHSL